MVVNANFFFAVYSLYYAKPRNKSEGPHLRVIAPAGNTAFSKKFCSGRKPLAIRASEKILGGRKIDIDLPNVIGSYFDFRD